MKQHPKLPSLGPEAVEKGKLVWFLRHYHYEEGETVPISMAVVYEKRRDFFGLYFPYCRKEDLNIDLVDLDDVQWVRYEDVQIIDSEAIDIDELPKVERPDTPSNDDIIHNIMDENINDEYDPFPIQLTVSRKGNAEGREELKSYEDVRLALDRYDSYDLTLHDRDGRFITESEIETLLLNDSISKETDE